MSQEPDQIGHYTVARRLGSGGMGEVFLAFSPAGEPVAIKLIRADRLDQQTRARFEQEALKARTIVGTSRVARFLDAGPYDEPRPWMAMEYVPGPTLDAFVDAAAPLSALLAASLGALLAEGLAAVHRVGLLHRDLKPGNVMLGENGPMIIDFGLSAFADASSSLSHAGMQIGTPVTMPPEQANGETRVTTAADVYGLGTVLLYASAGHYPYRGVSRDVILARVASAEIAPELDGLPAELTELVTAMLEHDPADRPTLDQVTRTCTGVVADLNWTMARARRALLAHFERHAERSDDGDSFETSPSLEARIDAEAAAITSAEGNGDIVLASPLDGSPGLFAQGSPELGPGDQEQAAEQEQPAAPGSSPAAPAGRPRRVPASDRVAAELRQAYAARSAL